MVVKQITNNQSKFLAGGKNDVVSSDSSTLVKDTPAPTVLVNSSSDLENLPAYPAGTIAFTAGFAAIWQLSPSGEWVSVI